MRRVHGKVRSGWIRIVMAGATLGLVVALTPTARAQTPDGETPANEGVCDELMGATPGLYGLCVGFCEAQDCEASVDASTDEVTFDADCEPSAPHILANYNKRALPGDPPMPCVNVTLGECPCWTEAELDAFEDTGVTECTGGPGHDLIFIDTGISGTRFAQSYEGDIFPHNNPIVCKFWNADVDRYIPVITPDEHIVCRESIRAECADRGFPIP
jgi:hypothetical protein